MLPFASERPNKRLCFVRIFSEVQPAEAPHAVCVNSAFLLRHVPQLDAGQRGAAESQQAAAASGRGDGRSGVGHRQNWPHLPGTVHPPGSSAHAALTRPPFKVKALASYPECSPLPHRRLSSSALLSLAQQQRHGPPAFHEAEEHGALVRPVAGDVGRPHHAQLPHLSLPPPAGPGRIKGVPR